MLQFEELRLDLLKHENELKSLSEALGLETLKKEIERLEKETAKEGFWNDPSESQKVLQNIFTVLRQNTFGVKLHAVNRKVFMLHRHNFAVRQRPRSYF